MAEFIEVLKQGKRLCENQGVCNKCPLKGMCSGNIYKLHEKSEEIESIVMNWAKDHPVKTNLDKLLEVFPEIDRSTLPSGSCFGFSCPNKSLCEECKHLGFWNREYKENNNG